MSKIQKIISGLNNDETGNWKCEKCQDTFKVSDKAVKISGYSFCLSCAKDLKKEQSRTRPRR